MAVTRVRHLQVAERTQTLWELATGAIDASMAAAGAAVRTAVDRFQVSLRTPTVDFHGEGLLDGCDDAAARLELLRELHAAGVPLDELRRAVAEDRLALLPLEAVLRPSGRFSVGELSQRSGISPDQLRRFVAALGLGTPEGEARFDEGALAAAHALAELRDAGLSDAAIEELCRMTGRRLGTLSEGIREVFGEAFLKAGDSERDVGLRYAGAARRLLPVLEPILRFGLTMHLSQLIGSDVVTQTERATGALPGSHEVAVGFADLTGFTDLSERLEPERLGLLVRRFDGLVQESTPCVVRHVKTVGDAAMLVSPEPQALVDAVARLVRASARPESGIPRIHAGIAFGRAVSREGDWHGQPVNLASRLAEAAPSGHVFVTEEVRDRTSSRFRYVGRAELKGLAEPIGLFSLMGDADTRRGGVRGRA